MSTYNEFIEMADLERDTGSTSCNEAYWLEQAYGVFETDSQAKSVLRRLAQVERDTGSTSCNEAYWLEQAMRY